MAASVLTNVCWNPTQGNEQLAKGLSRCGRGLYVALMMRRARHRLATAPQYC
jgi:hypothetical protein